MRRKIGLVLVSLLILAAIGGAAYFFYFKNLSPPLEIADAEPVEAEQVDEDIPDIQTNLNPDLSIDSNGLSRSTAHIYTERGLIKFKFYPKDAPQTVDRIIELINSGFYNGLIFHRVVPGFVIQGGDPTGKGTGGSGKKLRAEFNQRRHVDGTVAMARAMDPNSADSQFYITLGPQPHLDRKYTIFGQVIEGMDVVRQIQPGDRMRLLVIQ